MWKNLKIYFSDFFDVDEDIIESYGAVNISLINDMPLFVDPFLLFNSEKPEYQQIHAEIIRYLLFCNSRRETMTRRLKECYRHAIAYYVPSQQ